MQADDDGKVFIGDLDKVELLKALWLNAKPAAYFNGCRSPLLIPPFNAADAQKAVLKYVDYFCGRCIKSDLSGDYAHPGGYDRDWGRGAFADVVKLQRVKKTPLPDLPVYGYHDHGPTEVFTSVTKKDAVFVTRFKDDGTYEAFENLNGIEYYERDQKIAGDLFEYLRERYCKQQDRDSDVCLLCKKPNYRPVQAPAPAPLMCVHCGTYLKPLSAK